MRKAAVITYETCIRQEFSQFASSSWPAACKQALHLRKYFFTQGGALVLE
jgi:hypothetical protein